MPTQLVHPADDLALRVEARPVVRRVPQSSLTYRDGVHELILIVPHASPRLVSAVRQGEAEFALIEDSPLLVLAYRFGEAVPWSPATFDRSSVPPRERPLPPVGAEIVSRALLHVALVDAEGGAPATWRNLTLSLDFTHALHAAIREQAATSFDPSAHRRALDRLRRYGSSSTALVARAVARTLGSC